MKLSRYNIYKRNTKDTVTIFNTLSRSMVTIAISLIKEIHDGKENAVSEENGFLEDNGFICEDDIDEFRVFSFWFNKRIHEETRFTISFFPISGYNCADPCCLGKCNDMSLSTFNQSLSLIDSVLSMTSAMYVDLNYFYNGTLNNAQFIEILDEYACRVKDKSDINLQINVVTNGMLLTTDIIRSFTYKHVKSVDLILSGCSEQNNAFNLERYEKQDTNKICKSVIQLLEMGFEVTLSGNTENSNDLFLRNCLTQIPKDCREKIHIKLTLLGSENSSMQAHNLLEERNKIDNFVSILRLAVDLGYQLSPLSYGDTPCIAETDNTLIIDSYGDIYKCYCCAGRHSEKIANVFDSSTLVFQKMLASKASYVTQVITKECKECEFLPLCRSGCVLDSKVARKKNICHREFYNHLATSLITNFGGIDDQPT